MFRVLCETWDSTANTSEAAPLHEWQNPLPSYPVLLCALCVKGFFDCRRLVHSPQNKTPQTHSSRGTYVDQPSPKCCSIRRLT
jgi:hypothetical protein